MTSKIPLVGPGALNVFIYCRLPRSVELTVNPKTVPQPVALPLPTDVCGYCVKRMLRHFRNDVTRWFKAHCQKMQLLANAINIINNDDDIYNKITYSAPISSERRAQLHDDIKRLRVIIIKQIKLPHR